MTRYLMLALLLVLWFAVGAIYIVGSEDAHAWRTSDSARGAALMTAPKQRPEAVPPTPTFAPALPQQETATLAPTAILPSSRNEPVPSVVDVPAITKPAALPTTPANALKTNADAVGAAARHAAPKTR